MLALTFIMVLLLTRLETGKTCSFGQVNKSATTSLKWMRIRLCIVAAFYDGSS